jgi:hypothetical protein
MLFNKGGNWHIYYEFHVLNKLTLKGKIPIPIIDNLLDDFHGSNLFTKLDLHLSYHQIWMKDMVIP